MPPPQRSMSCSAAFRNWIFLGNIRKRFSGRNWLAREQMDTSSSTATSKPGHPRGSQYRYSTSRKRPPLGSLLLVRQDSTRYSSTRPCPRPWIPRVEFQPLSDHGAAVRWEISKVWSLSGQSPSHQRRFVYGFKVALGLPARRRAGQRHRQTAVQGLRGERLDGQKRCECHGLGLAGHCGQVTA
jgi:hypothetical protein